MEWHMLRDGRLAFMGELLGDYTMVLPQGVPALPFVRVHTVFTSDSIA